MSVALAGRAPATFEIKSANLPLVSLLLKSADLAALAEELKAQFGEIPGFFDHDPMVIDLTPLKGQGAIDFDELLHLLRAYSVMPVAVRGGSREQMEAALLKGLARADELAAVRQAQPERKLAPVRTEPQAVARAEPANQARAEPPSPSRAEPVEAPRLALIIDKPLRSGQQVYAKGRDLVVLSMVNAGAEVIADGSIHVYAPLRGKAIAGAKGNTEARIFSTCLEPELVSIAGIYRTSEVPLPPEVLGRPTQIRLVGGTEGKLVMDPLK